MSIDVNSAETQSDYDLVGGGPAVAAVVGSFYERVLGDDRLAPHFVGVDLPRLKRHQVLLVSQVMGGPAEYDGRDLQTAHQHLQITDGDFGAVVEHLVASFEEFSVPGDVVGRVVTALGATKPDVVNAN